MRFSQLIAGGLGELRTSADPEVTGLSIDSRTVQAGDVFFCMPGHRVDSHTFLGEAARRGAVAAVVSTDFGVQSGLDAGLAVLRISADDTLRTAAQFARRFYGRDLDRLSIIGITGTNGKTTTAWVLAQALDSLQGEVAYLGTLGDWSGGAWSAGENTTPLAIPLARKLAGWAHRGVRHAVIEVSSHALAEHRVDSLAFACVVFTNLTQDHLDFHGTMAAYQEAKRRLFFDSLLHRPDCLKVLNVCDPVGRAWSAELLGSIGYGTCAEASVRMSIVAASASGLELELPGGARMTSRLAGRFNAENLCAAYAVLLNLGFAEDRVRDALAKVAAAPGRFESIPNDRGIGVIVDYAHTPDAVENLLASARDLDPRRIVLVIGCGGDRDRTKRPRMAAAAAHGADLAIFTSDNPRTEDPEHILDDMDSGLGNHSRRLRIVDRRAAIRRAIELAEPGDLVLIAGKGHESVQVIGTTEIPFDDAQVARDLLEEAWPT